VLHVEREALLTSKPYITCQQLIDFIASYRDNDLAPDQRSEFDRHLAVCPSCVAYLKTYEQTVLLARASAGEPVPDEIPEPLVKAILDARRKSDG
jgi:anti-sigma factor RsiW